MEENENVILKNEDKNIPVTDLKTGLTDAVVIQLRQQYGYNEVTEKEKSAIGLLVRHFWGLTAWMLEAIVIISFILHKTFDAWLFFHC